MTLTPAEAQDLVQLKALLDRAVDAARGSAPLGRLTAVVLLDAVNERVMHVVAGRAGLQLSERDQFSSVADKVAAALDTAWQRQGWSEVRRLHRVRNLAQHEGLPADRDLLPGFVAATTLFTRTLVDVMFGVDLDEVTLTAAVTTPRLAELLQEAEQQVETDPGGAVEAAVSAFYEAARAWRAARPYRMRPMRGVDDPFRDVDARLDQLDERHADEAFAPSPVDLLWFRRLADDTRNRRATPSVDEARRAVSFVFWAVIEWEAFATSYVPNRHLASLTARRQVRCDPAATATVADVTVRTYTGDAVEATFRLRDVPGEEDFKRWSSAVRARLADVQGAGRVYVELDGSVVAPLTADFDADVVVARLDHALSAADEDVRQQRMEEEAAEAEAVATDEAYRQAAASVRFPPWVLDVGAGVDQGAGPPSASVRVVLDRAFAPGRLHQAIRQHEKVQQCFGNLAEETVIQPRLDPADLALVLGEVDAQLRPEVEARDATAARSKARAVSAQLALEVALARAGQRIGADGG